MAFSNLNNDPELLIIKTKNDAITELKYRTEKRDHEIILKTPKIDNEYYRGENKSLSEKKVLLKVTEKLKGSESTSCTSTMPLVNPSLGIVLTSSTALSGSIATLITNEYIPKINIRLTRLGDWINVNALLYEKTLKQSMINKKKQTPKKNWS